MEEGHLAGNALGTTHPARSPDTKEISHQHIEPISKEATEATFGEEQSANHSTQESISGFEASASNEDHNQQGLDAYPSESTALDEPCLSNAVPSTINSSQLDVQEKSRMSDGEDSSTADIEKRSSISAVSEERFPLNSSESTFPTDSGRDERLQIYQATADGFASVSSGDIQSPAESSIFPKQSIEGHPDLNRFNRTNSFPEVPLLPHSSLPAQSLSHSQAEKIIEEDEHEDTGAEYRHSLDARQSRQSEPYHPTQNSLSDHLDEEPSNVFSPVAAAGGHIQLPPDDEARFEEGLPLMGTISKEKTATQDKYWNLGTRNDFPDPGHEVEEDPSKSPDFVAKEEEDFRPQALDRKTTSQVLDSMQYPPHEETHDDGQPSTERPSLPNLMGGGIAVSSSTVISQVLSEQTGNNGKSESGEDLAAMWQAALDDDELLEEDAPGDPSGLFEDNGAESLSDDLGNTAAQPTFSPDLQPVYSPGGSMEGFTNSKANVDINSSTTSSKYTPSHSSQLQNQNSEMYFTGQAHPTIYQRATHDLSSSTSEPTDFRPTTGQQPFHGDTSTRRPQMPPSAQSFADKAKGGYTSPYDLPMDIKRPKKRNITQQLRPGSSNSHIGDRPSAPPRSSSMFASGTPALDSHPPLPTLPKSSSATRSLPSSDTASSRPKNSASEGTFFEELPSVKPRSLVGTARTHAQIPSPNPSFQSPPLQPQTQQGLVQQKPSPGSSSGTSGYGLIPTVRTGPYAGVHLPAPNGPDMPSVTSRYSPAPVPQSNVPPSRTRYAASPAGSARAPPPASLPFQPRTSSPLAQANVRSGNLQEKVHSDESPGSSIYAMHQELTRQKPLESEIPSYGPQVSRPLGHSSDYESSKPATSDSPTLYDSSPSNHFSPSPPTNHYGPTSSSSLRSHTVNKLEPDRQTIDVNPLGYEGQYPVNSPAEFAPPRRSQTQSPGAVTSKPSVPSATQDIYQRPASVNSRAFPQQVVGNTTVEPFASRPSRSFSQNMQYIRPTDGREHDPLERWKGCPLFTFGFGGTIVTSFPKKVPRYAAGHIAPLMKCSPGEVKIQSRKTYLDDLRISDFPGPLKSKSKKKDVAEWLQQQILRLQQSHSDDLSSTTLPDSRKRNEEKILLWRIMKVFVEYDGVIEGKSSAEQAVRLILLPELNVSLPEGALPSSDSQLLGVSRASGSSNILNPTQAGDVETLRRILLQGEREKAVWHALDRRLWAHAMLISSTMDKTIWKQVLQEFIRQEVKSSWDNTESLASLYQIFAGNWEESVDELVPPSARAGLQFVSKAAGTGPTRNALGGLDRWRETLTLALSNRTFDDSKALVALGRLLLGYGRVEAAHICFIFAKVPGIFGGVDDPQASVTLFGADHNLHPADFSRDIDSILLTEIYEYASTALAPSSTVTVSPHLQAYKLYHAMLLAEHGLRNDAQEYCTVVASAMKSTTKLSPYYHSLLYTALDDLINRLRQAPSAASASWMSKPSLDKVSGSFLSRVNQFIAGDEKDNDSAASSKGTDPAAGPFAGVTADTPNISPSPSSYDLYNAYPSGVPLSNSTAPMSRYAPGGQYAVQGQYTPRSSMEQNHGGMQDPRHPSHNDMLRAQLSNNSRPSSSGNIYQKAPQQLAKSYQPAPQPATYSPQHESYPTPPTLPEYMPVAPPEELSASLYAHEPYDPTPAPDHQPPQIPYQFSSETPLDIRQGRIHPLTNILHQRSRACNPHINHLQYRNPHRLTSHQALIITSPLLTVYTLQIAQQTRPLRSKKSRRKSLSWMTTETTSKPAQQQYSSKRKHPKIVKSTKPSVKPPKPTVCPPLFPPL